MSNSSLVVYDDRRTTHYSSRSGRKISRITIHHAAGGYPTENNPYPNNLHMLGDMCLNRECSYNYGVANDGSIGLYVDEANAAWTTSSWENDSQAVTIEVCNSTGDPTWEISDAAYNALLDLCEDICRRNNIPKLTYTGQLEGSNLTMHRWFKATLCPGPYLYDRFAHIAESVNARLGSPSSIKYPTGTSVSTYDTVLTGQVVDPLTIINEENIKPYIATIDVNTSDVNYSALMKMGVVGVMLNAGSLFNSIYLRNERYRNSRLKKEIPNIEKVGLAYGLYATVRARNKSEAQEECNELYYTISKYPPELGLWLELDLSKSKSMNDIILDTYYANIDEWGLSNRCGLYCNRKQLEKVSWDKHQEHYYLWLKDHLDDLSPLNQLLTPELFKLNG